MREDVISLESFAGQIRNDLVDRFRDRYPEIQMEVQQVDKLNRGSYLGLQINRGEGRPSPVINLEPFYEELAEGSAYSEAMERLASAVEKAMQSIPDIDIKHIGKYEEIKTGLIMQAIPVKGNEEMLAYMPYQNMADLAIICRAMIGSDSRGEMSFLVTDQVMQSYGVSNEELFADAAESMSRGGGYSIRPIISVLGELKPFFDEDPEHYPDNMLFVATNSLEEYGAGVLACPGFMEMAEQTMRGSFFVLPSSIHEVLLLRDDGATDYRHLEMMVREINAMEVAPQDRLSDHVYHYDAQDKVFELASRYEERMQERMETLQPERRLSVLADLKEKQAEALSKPSQVPRPHHSEATL